MRVGAVFREWGQAPLNKGCGRGGSALGDNAGRGFAWPMHCRAPASPPRERTLGLPVRGAVCRITEGSGSKVRNNQPGRASWLSTLYAGAAGMLGINLRGGLCTEHFRKSYRPLMGKCRTIGLCPKTAWQVPRYLYKHGQAKERRSQASSCLQL